jgi:hypothetical protein
MISFVVCLLHRTGGAGESQGRSERGVHLSLDRQLGWDEATSTAPFFGRVVLSGSWTVERLRQSARAAPFSMMLVIGFHCPILSTHAAHGGGLAACRRPMEI